MTPEMENPYPEQPEYPTYPGPSDPAQASSVYDGAAFFGETYIPPEEPGEPRGIWGFWLRFSGPVEPLSRDAAGRELIRRARLLSIMLLVTLIVILAILPKGFIPILDFGTFGAVTIAALTLIICIPLSRAGMVNGAGTVFCIGVTLALAWSLLDTPNGLGMQDLPTYDLFSLPIVIAGILLPRRAPFFFWLGCALFIIGDVTYEAHQPNLAAYIQQSGLYATVIIPLILTFVIAVVSWLGSGSVERAILEADRSADLERAYRMITEQKRRLEGAISMIQSVHARVANGDFTARAPVGGGELMGLGVSLNLMLDRLGRLRGAEGALGSLEQGARLLAQYTWELGAGHLYSPPPPTGSALLDAVAAGLDQMRRTVFAQISALATAMQNVTRAGEEILNVERALSIRAQESGRRIGALNDAVQAIRATAEHAESSLIAPAQWLEQATAQGWTDGIPLAQTIGESLSTVRQVIAVADQSPTGASSQEVDIGVEREIYERSGAAERDFNEALAQTRGLLSRMANQSGNLGPPRLP
ncbi:MAG TPA: methyl-accepting chemotaxis protein [Ktedonobacterales bacterium]